MTQYAFGLGARRGVAAGELIEVVTRVAAQHGLQTQGAQLYALQSKSEEGGFHEAAQALGATLVFLPLAALKARKGSAATHSPRVQAMFGVGSVSEAAALVGAGVGSRLLAPRISTRFAACAVARSVEEA